MGESIAGIARRTIACETFVFACGGILQDALRQRRFCQETFLLNQFPSCDVSEDVPRALIQFPGVVVKFLERVRSRFGDCPLHEPYEFSCIGQALVKFRCEVLVKC